MSGVKLKLDLHDVYNRGGEIDRALRAIIDEAVAKKAPLVDPGSTYRFKVVFKKAGSYRFLCTPHFKLGMSGTIRIRT